MFETVDKTTDRGAVTDWDSFIKELNEPKEEITATPQFSQGTDREPIEGDPTAGYNAGSEFPEENYSEPISSDVAAMSGKMIAGTIDTTLGTGFSLYAKTTEAEKYQAKEKQIEQLNNAWTAVAQKYDYKVEDSPWFNVLLLTVAVYLPIWQEAKKDRRFAEMDDRITEIEKKLAAKEKELETTEQAA